MSIHDCSLVSDLEMGQAWPSMLDNVTYRELCLEDVIFTITDNRDRFRST